MVPKILLSSHGLLKWCYESWCRKEKASHHVRWFSWFIKYHGECHVIRTWLLDNHFKYRHLAKTRKQEKQFDEEEDYRNSDPFMMFAI